MLAFGNGGAIINLRNPSPTALWPAHATESREAKLEVRRTHSLFQGQSRIYPSNNSYSSTKAVNTIMSASFVAACEQRAADAMHAAPAAPEPPLIVRQATAIFREDLLSLVLEHLLLPDLCSTLAVDVSFRAQTRARIETLWPALSPLMSPPWRLTAAELLSKTVLHVDRLSVEVRAAEMTAFASAIASSGALAKLELLNLSGNAIGDAGMTALVDAIRASGALASLQKLWLVNNRIGDAGLTALAVAIRTSGPWGRFGLFGSPATALETLAWPLLLMHVTPVVRWRLCSS